MNTIQAELWASTGTSLGEGPLWIPPNLWSIDIPAGTLLKIPLLQHGKAGSITTYTLGVSIGSVVPGLDDTLVAALKDSIVAFNPETGSKKVLWQDAGTWDTLRFNDGKCDPAGRFLVGTMHERSLPERGSLYSFTPEGYVLETLLHPVSISNGLAWDSSGSILYYIDTLTRDVMKYTYDLDTGLIGNPVKVVSIPESMGMPDGMTIDRDGMLWVALWGGNGVGCWDPISGFLKCFIEVPARFVTSCAFGGTELDILFITTAADRQAGTDGNIYSCKPGSQGLVPDRFGC